jgi:hypothetical protein
MVNPEGYRKRGLVDLLVLSDVIVGTSLLVDP